MPDPRSDDPQLRRDIAHTLLVSGLACVLSLGLVYVLYLRRVWRVARQAPHHDPGADYVLVFGKQLRDDGPDGDFSRRLARALQLARQQPRRPLVLLGGGDGETEAAAAARHLREAGLPGEVPLWLEDESLDTLQNLRNARELLAGRAPGTVLLLSNRYHLARCELLAAQMGFEHRVCAAEPEFRWDQQPPAVLLREAAYLCWLDIGTRWARLIRHRRMIERVH